MFPITTNTTTPKTSAVSPIVSPFAAIRSAMLRSTLIFAAILMTALSTAGCDNLASIQHSDFQNTYPLPRSDTPGDFTEAMVDGQFVVKQTGDVTFTKAINLGGIGIFATDTISDAKMLHAAAIMAEYLDNDQDGFADDIAVWNEMVKNRARVSMFATDEINSVIGYDIMQDLQSHETIVGWTPHSRLRFDASLEEIFHVITNAGLTPVYPELFSEAIDSGSLLSKAMDVARGGQFDSIPWSYPKSAWYTYDDPTCDYACQTTEYLYWLLTTKLGAQAGRTEEIDNEWRLNTPQDLRSGNSRYPEGDKLGWQLVSQQTINGINNPLFHMRKLPTGNYNPTKSK